MENFKKKMLPLANSSSLIKLLKTSESLSDVWQFATTSDLVQMLWLLDNSYKKWWVLEYILISTEAKDEPLLSMVNTLKRGQIPHQETARRLFHENKRQKNGTSAYLLEVAYGQTLSNKRWAAGTIGADCQVAEMGGYNVRSAIYNIYQLQDFTLLADNFVTENE